MPLIAAETPFDHQTMLDRLKGDVNHAADLMALYQRYSPAMMQDIRRAVADADATAFTSAAHRLKGASSHLHAEPVERAARFLETLGRKHDLDAAANALVDLERQWLLLLDAVAAFLDPLLPG